MRYTAVAETDVGIIRQTNQDSVLIKHASYSEGEILLAIICDGMGGLSKGELASATVIRAFAAWFDNELPFELEHFDPNVLGGKWSYMLKDLNMKIREYSQNNGISGMGTTFSGLLLNNDKYLFAHVGDSRIYYICNGLSQLTTDQTFIAREIQRGTMTIEQAKVDKRRNLLLQCIGASQFVEPQVQMGTVEKGVYMLCSDGFRHEVSEEEMVRTFAPPVLADKNAMHNSTRYLIELAKRRGERDNISVILVKAE